MTEGVGQMLSNPNVFDKFLWRIFPLQTAGFWGFLSRYMKCCLVFLTGLIFIAVASLITVSGMALGFGVGKLTDSGFAGICGAYGPDAGLVACIYFGSLPAGLVGGTFTALFFRRRIARRS